MYTTQEMKKRNEEKELALSSPELEGRIDGQLRVVVVVVSCIQGSDDDAARALLSDSIRCFM